MLGRQTPAARHAWQTPGTVRSFSALNVPACGRELAPPIAPALTSSMPADSAWSRGQSPGYSCGRPQPAWRTVQTDLAAEDFVKTLVHAVTNHIGHAVKCRAVDHVRERIL